jgi:hypothetical protein
MPRAPGAVLRALADLANAALLTAQGPGLRPVRFLLLCVAAWFVYTPIHELLHVAGCVLTGGAVRELQLSARYGGHLLARVFDFVRVEGDYAGRLTGFDTGGSDLCYLATTFAPYVLTPLVGFPLLALGIRRRALLPTAVGLIVGAAPLVGLFGDYYELGSILVTRAARPLSGGFDPTVLRSDDLFRLIGELARDPARHGAVGLPGALRAGALVTVSQIAGALLALYTMAAGLWVIGGAAPSPRAAARSGPGAPG